MFKVKKTHGVKVWVDLRFAFSSIGFDLELLSMNLEQKSFIEMVDGWVVILNFPPPCSHPQSSVHPHAEVLPHRQESAASGDKNAEAGTLGVCL